MNTDTPTTPKRGRKPINFSFPSGEWKVKDLAAQKDVSIPFVHLRMKEAGEKIKWLREDKVPGQKGRSAGIYEYNESPATQE